MGKNIVVINKKFLQGLIRITPKNRKLVIDKASPQQLRSIRESVLNVANRNVPVRPNVLKRLKRYKTVLKKLAFLKQTDKSTRRLINQNGGFLPALIPPVLAYLASTLFNG